MSLDFTLDRTGSGGSGADTIGLTSTSHGIHHLGLGASGIIAVDTSLYDPTDRLGLRVRRRNTLGSSSANGLTGTVTMSGHASNDTLSLGRGDMTLNLSSVEWVSLRNSVSGNKNSQQLRDNFIGLAYGNGRPGLSEHDRDQAERIRSAPAGRAR